MDKLTELETDIWTSSVNVFLEQKWLETIVNWKELTLSLNITLHLKVSNKNKSEDQWVIKYIQENIKKVKILK
jgi:hypothetical protein